MLTIRVPARVHITLIDLGDDGYRRNGGIGFSLDSPSSIFSFSANPSVDISELIEFGFTSNEIQKLTSILDNEKKYRNCSGVRLVSAELPSRHCGLGTGTAMALACVEAFFILNDILVSRSEIIRLSGRGGASGIGVHGYFAGGFVFDVGRSFDGNPVTSSDNMTRDFKIPKEIVRLNFPKWPIGILRFPSGTEPSLAAENNLFSQLLPLSDEKVHEVAYHSIFGVCAAIADDNFKSFCRAINKIQHCAWKSAEIALHGDLVANTILTLQQMGCDAVGMSSVGPTLYFFAHDFIAVYDRLLDTLPDMNISRAWPSNDGREICHD